MYAYMDTYTDGYHLGAYSQVRRDLHMCVGYAGHNTYAQLATKISVTTPSLPNNLQVVQSGGETSGAVPKRWAGSQF